MLWKLIKIRLKSVFVGLNKGSKKGNSAGVKILLTVLLGYAAVCFIIMFGNIYLSLANSFAGTDFSWLYFAMVGLMNLILGFISTVFAAQSQIFNAKDNELLLSMPISVKDIIISRIATLLVIDGVEDIILGVMALLIYMTKVTVTPAGIIMHILEIIGLMLITSFLSTLFGWILAAITSKMKNKAAFTTALSVILMAAYFWIFSKGQNYIQQIAENGQQIAGSFKNGFYPLYAMGSAVTEGNFTGFLIYMAIAIIPFVIMVVLISKSFIRIATSKTGTKKSLYKEKQIKVKSAKEALIGKELRHFFSSAPYMLNGGFGLIIILVASVFLVIKKNMMLDVISKTPEISNNISIIALLVLCAVNMFNFISAPSISLEGDNLWIAKSLPVEPYKILISKVITHVRISAPFSIISSIACNYVLDMSIIMRIMIFLVPLASIVFIGYIGLICNLVLPKLDWADETVAVKQSMSVLLVMAIVFLFYVFAGFMCFFSIKLGILDVIFAVATGAAFVIPCICMNKYLHNSGSRRFVNL